MLHLKKNYYEKMACNSGCAQSLWNTTNERTAQKSNKNYLLCSLDLQEIVVFSCLTRKNTLKFRRIQIYQIFHKFKINDIQIDINRDMIPLPYATKENYKVMFYRLCDIDVEKVCRRKKVL